MSETQKIEAIPATLHGARFRSTLEAHWAAFFEALGASWQYEPETHHMASQKFGYTPDFYLPGLKTIIEVKPCPVTEPRLIDKYSDYGPELVRRRRCKLFLFAVGSPRPGLQLHGWWRYGERGFTFEAVYGEHAVAAACLVADHTRPDQEDDVHKAGGLFDGMTLGEIKDLTLEQVKAMYVGLSYEDIKLGVDCGPYVERYNSRFVTSAAKEAS